MVDIKFKMYRGLINVHDNETYSTLSHDAHYGIIGPGLFAVGIAFPALATDRFSAVEAQIGLGKFMVYLKKLLLIWVQCSA